MDVHYLKENSSLNPKWNETASVGLPKIRSTSVAKRNKLFSIKSAGKSLCEPSLSSWLCINSTMQRVFFPLVLSFTWNINVFSKVLSKNVLCLDAVLVCSQDFPENSGKDRNALSSTSLKAKVVLDEIKLHTANLLKIIRIYQKQSTCHAYVKYYIWSLHCTSKNAAADDIT